METAVRKATRLEFKPPKLKHLSTLTNLTIENPSSIDGIMINLEKRHKEKSWIITFKVLIVLHYLMRHGNCTEVIDAILKNPSAMDTSRINNKSSAPASIQNIYLYRAYMDEKVIAFRHIKRDYSVKASSAKEGRLRRLSIASGLLREIEILQQETESLLKCKFSLNESDSAITLFAYKMTIEDLLALFQAVNEGVVNILEHYFEMNKKDATAALDIYRTFAQQTEETIEYLNIAKKIQGDLQMSIPTLKHAPLSLAAALEEYLKDGADSNINKRVDAVKPQSSLHNYQKQQPLVFSEPALSQQAMTTSPIQTQNDLFNDTFFNNSNRFSNSLSDSFTPTSPYQQAHPTTATQNPFASQDQVSSPTNNSLGGPFFTIGHTQINNNQQQPSAVIGRSATFSVGNSNNPFRSLGNNNNITGLAEDPWTQQHRQSSLLPQTIEVVKPNMTGSYNPFATPMTPPLTSNHPMFMPQQQQQQTLDGFQSTSSRNPFAQQNLNHSTFQYV